MSLLRTDRRLLEAYRRGVPDAMERVYWEYVGKVEHLLRAGFEVRGRGIQVKCVCREPAELADLVQEVFARAFSEKARRRYDGQRDFGPYLYTIARNALVDWARARGREIPADCHDLETAIDLVPVSEDTVPWASAFTMQVVEAYLSGLPRDLQELHQLRHEKCLSQERAAEALGISRQTLRTLERRLQEGLAAALENTATQSSMPTQIGLRP
jgi:RNA polymerase sigma-70 factor (ECF subfamily)